jgi:hypothetical protein
LALNLRSILPADPAAGGLPDRLVTVGAASLALLVVAAIAILMGMA